MTLVKPMKQAFFSSTGGSSGNSVKWSDQITVSAGTSVTLNCAYTSTGYPTLFWCVSTPTKLCSFFKETQWKTARSLQPEILKIESPPLWNTQSRYQTQPCTTVSWETQCQGHRGKLCKNLEGPDGVCSEASNLKLKNVVLSHRQSCWDIVRRQGEAKWAATASKPGTQGFFHWKWGEGKGSQIMYLLSIRWSLSCPQGFLAWGLGIRF